MQELDIIDTINFIKQLNELGLQLSCINNELLLKAPQDFAMSDEIIEELRARKKSIIEYLSSSSSAQNYNSIENEAQLKLNILKSGDIVYHQITPVEKYWMNSEIDAEYEENKETIAFNYLFFNITGNVNVPAFKEAVILLLNRHESLRATFHKIDNSFYMRVNALPDGVSIFDYRDFSPQQLFDKNETEAFIGFENHKFYFEKGPLISFRICKVEQDEFVLGIKIHHIIFDSWSRDIILRDVFVLYNNCLKENKLELPVLNYQLKDYLAFTNIHQKNKQEEEKAHWLNKYSDLPGELIIPGTKKAFTPASEKICRISVFKLSTETIQKIDDLSAKYVASRFTILQSFFLAYISKITSQNDLVLGSYIFGRDYFDANDLIGCFAKTVLLRVSLDEQDSVKSIISKVQAANSEMRDYIAYPLIKAMEDLLPPDEKIYGKFWKLNFHYIELKGGFAENELVKQSLNNSALKLSPRKEAENEYLTPIDMQLTFLVNENKITLEVQYDSSLYLEDTINNMMQNYLSSF